MIRLKIWVSLVFGFLTLTSGCVTAQSQDVTGGRIQRAHAASSKLVAAIESVDGNLGVHTARSHDGVELIMAWFENKRAVLNWFEHPYHRKMLADAGRPEDGIAAQHFGHHTGPILVIASVAYRGAPGSLEAPMFDDPDGRKPTRFAVEYYVPLAGGAYMIEPFAPPEAAAMVHGLRDVFDDDDHDCAC
ncbi:MAG: hypothetical protein AAFR03_01105 [Pseudomonadota bacterium]